MNEQVVCLESEGEGPRLDGPDGGWRVACERAAFAAAELLVLSGRRPSMAAAVEMLRSLPTSAQECVDVNQSAFLRYAREALDRGTGPRLTASLDEFDRIVGMKPGDREALVECLIGAFVGWSSGG